jgi:hypothetical protein
MLTAVISFVGYFITPGGLSSPGEVGTTFK